MLVDGSQSVPHSPVDVAALGADFLAFTSHKMCGPTGVGVLWGRFELLDAMPPFLGGGSMIETVTLAGSTYMPPPARFEAGTPPIAEVVGLGAAVDYLSGIGMAAVAEHEKVITRYALDGLKTVPGLTILGPQDAHDHGGAISFELDGVHPHDVATVLDTRGIAVRAGHHCARPVHERFGMQSSTRASFYLYTTPEEVDALVDGLGFVRSFFKVD
jgi:cysteine desulfurase/selenocysteine lyase